MDASPPPAKGSRLISRVLPMAVKLWLQTQLDDIGQLAFDVQATDRQVLSGAIPGISLSAQQAVYQGIHISQVTVYASEININIGQVLRGKPLRLKEAFPIEGQVTLDAAAMAASSTKSLLADGLLEFWQTLLGRPDVAEEVATHYGGVTLNPSQFSQCQALIQTLDGGLVLDLVQPDQSRLSLRGWLVVVQGHVLILTQPRWGLASGEDVPSQALKDFRWDLGEQTHVKTLTVENDILTCDCRIMVQP